MSDPGAAWTRLTFAIADEELGIGVERCAMPLLDGVPLRTLAGRDDGASALAGFAPEELARRLGAAREGAATVVQVLRCVCGDDGCGWARVTIEPGAEQVVWRELRVDGAGGALPAAAGPFHFARADYDAALATLSRSGRRV